MMWAGPDCVALRHLEPVLGVDGRVVAVEDVDAAAEQPVRAHPVGDLVAGPALDAVVHPVGLARRVVRQLVLVQDRGAAVALPDRVVALEVLDEEARRRDVVAVDDRAWCPVFVCHRSVSVRPSTPWSARRHPGVVDQHVVAVDHERRADPPDVGPPTRKNTSDSVVGSSERPCRPWPCPWPCGRLPTCSSTGRALRARVDREPRDHHAGHVGHLQRNGAAIGGERGEPEAEHDRVPALDRQAVPDVVDARREQQVLPAVERAIDLLRRVRRPRDEEVAQRDRAPRSDAARPRDAPRVAPRRRHSDHVPTGCVDEQVRLLAADRRARVVYGGFGKPVSGGAPATPAKTWFQTPFDQLPISLLRVSHCCCDPLTTVPAFESATEAAARELRPGGAVVHERQRPALDCHPVHRRRLRDRPSWRSRGSRPGPAAFTFSVRLESERQGSPDATQLLVLRRRGSGCRPRPCRRIVTSAGEAPRPATSV